MVLITRLAKLSALWSLVILKKGDAGEWLFIILILGLG